MGYLLEFLFEVASVLDQSDDRPKARAFSIGCFAVGAIVSVALWFAFRKAW